MRNISAIDETFDINISLSYKLAVQQTPSGLSFTILDTVRRKYVAFKFLMFDSTLALSKDDQVKRFLQNDNFLSRQYKTTGFIYVTPNVSIVPSAVYSRENEKDLFRFSNLLPEDHQLITSD